MKFLLAGMVGLLLSLNSFALDCHTRGLSFSLSPDRTEMVIHGEGTEFMFLGCEADKKTNELVCENNRYEFRIKGTTAILKTNGESKSFKNIKCESSGE